MTHSAIEAEFNASFESDKKAFESLSPRDRKYVSKIAAIGFGTRQAIVVAGDFIVTAMETVFNILVRAPVAFLWRQGEKMAESSAGAPARVMAELKRGGLYLKGKGLGLLGKGIGALHRIGLMSGEKRDARLAAIAEKKERIEAKRDEISSQSREHHEKAKKSLRARRTRIGNALKKTGAFLEYYGAIGLYRAFKWMLDPRRPNGKPLLGNEKLNKAVGFTAATITFGVLAYQLGKIMVLGKILHVKLAQSALTSSMPAYLQVVQQTLLHPAITVGLTAVKFVTLPVIAAARGRMKSTDFTQGIAYEYNRRLRAHQAKKLRQEFNKTAKYEPKDDDPKWAEFQKKAVVAARRESFGFIRSFFRHIVEKASPEFYEVRYRHYAELRAEKKEKREEKKALAQQKATARTAPAPAYAPWPTVPRGPIAPGMGKDFDAAKKQVAGKKPPPPPAPPAPAIP